MSLYILRGLGLLSSIPGMIFLILGLIVTLTGIWALLAILKHRY